jgi:hypothetical protein
VRKGDNRFFSRIRTRRADVRSGPTSLRVWRRLSGLGKKSGCPLFLGLWAATAHAQPPQAPVVHASVDRTAVWVADRLNYSVEIVCPKGVDILSDDVAKEKLKTNGLDVVGMNATASTAPDGSTTHRIVYTLTTYHVDTPDLRIDPLTVRYFVKRPGQRLQDEAPAGEFQIPAESIAFRSTLANDPDAAGLRDGIDPAPRHRKFASAGSVGTALMLVSIAPLAFFAVATLARRRPRRQGRSARRMRQDERVTIGALQSMDLSTADGRRRAFDGVDSLVRAHLRDAAGLPGPALTPVEVAPRLEGRKLRVAPEEVAALLAACQQARYAPIEAIPSADACREAIEQARAVVAAG